MSAISIIEKFGGPRGLANKLSDFTGLRVPLTTVRAWREVNRIPSNRQDDVVETARHYKIAIGWEEFSGK